MRASKRTEHGEQAAVIQWAGYAQNTMPELRLLYAIPNGGLRDKRTAAILAAEGVKAGVPDLCLPVPRGLYHGLYVEMKVKPNKPSDEQWGWMSDLEQMGYSAIVCYSADEAILKITKYLAEMEIK